MKRQVLVVAFILFASQFNFLIGQEWGELVQVLHDNSGELDRLGYRVQIEGEWAVVGCPGFDTSRGRVFIYRLVNQEWVEYQILNPGDLMEYYSFGVDVSLHENYLVVGVTGEDEDENDEMPLDGAGAAYIYKLEDGFWVEYQKIVASDREESGGFGETVSIRGDYIVVGVPSEQEDENGLNPLLFAGAAYIFKREGDFWSEQQKVVAPERSSADNFGAKIALGDEFIAISATGEDEDENGMNPLNGAGTVYIFNLVGESWQVTQKLVQSDRQVAAEFGSDVDLSNNILIVGSPRTDNVNGAVYIFSLEDNIWTQQQKLTASDAEFADEFGNSVSISGNTLIIGAQAEDEDINQENTMPSSGSAYIFNLNDEWVEVQKIVASDRSEGLWFGSDVSLNDEFILIGAIGYDEGDLNMVGAAYFFSACANLTIDEVPPATSACEGESISLFANSNQGNINWYESSADPDPIFTGNEFISPELEAGLTSFWIDASNENCLTPRVEIEIDVLPAPDLIVDETEFNFCAGDAAVFIASTSSENEIYWYESQDAETFVSSGNTLTLNNQEQSITYWAEAENDVSGCKSNRIAITAEIVPIPNSPEAESPQIITVEGMTLEDLEVELESEDFTWYADELLTTVLPNNTILEDGITYYIVQTIDGCESLPTAILVEMVLETSEEFSEGITYYPNPVSTELQVLSEFRAITEIAICNSLGEMVFKRKGLLGNSIQVDLRDEPSGIYFMFLTLDKQPEVFKLIKR